MSIYTTLDENKEPTTLLLKGGPGTGKTWKAAHFPKPCFINFDKNLSGLKKLPKSVRDGIKVVNPWVKIHPTDPKKNVKLKSQQVWDNFMKQLAVILADPDIETVVIDSMTTMQEVVKDKILNSDQPTVQMQLQNWGTLERYWKALAAMTLTATDLDKTLVFIFHEKPYEDSSSGVKMIMHGLNLGGSMKDNFDLYFSDVWRTSVKPTNKEPEYWVTTAPSRTFSAKKTLDLPPTFKWDDQESSIMKQIGGDK